jgi:hypothetical protein
VAPIASAGTSFPRLQLSTGKLLVAQCPRSAPVLAQREVMIGIELPGNIGGKTFIGFSSGVCNRAEVCSPSYYLVNPKIHLRSREYILPLILSETRYDSIHWCALVSEEFDDMVLCNFHFLHFLLDGEFCPPNVPGIVFTRRSFTHQQMTDVAIISIPLR